MICLVCCFKCGICVRVGNGRFRNQRRIQSWSRNRRLEAALKQEATSFLLNFCFPKKNRKKTYCAAQSRFFIFFSKILRQIKLWVASEVFSHKLKYCLQQRIQQSLEETAQLFLNFCFFNKNHTVPHSQVFLLFFFLKILCWIKLWVASKVFGEKLEYCLKLCVVLCRKKPFAQKLLRNSNLFVKFYWGTGALFVSFLGRARGVAPSPRPKKEKKSSCASIKL